MNLASLPALGTALEGGIFAGLTTRKDGTHCAVVLLPAHKKDINWKDAKAWAEEQGGELPTRTVAALLYANVKDQLKPRWHWTSEEHELAASYAWYFTFNYGNQSDDHKSYEGSAVAVRLIPLTA
jgi:hypothetical protein